MEDLILLNACSNDLCADTAKFIALVDKNELDRNDLTWAEIQPFVRILGVTSQDLYELQERKPQSIHNIEGSLLKKFLNLCRILKSKYPAQKILQIAQETSNLKIQTKSLKEKQQKCLEICAKNIKKIHFLVNNLTIEPSSTNNSQSLFADQILQIKNISLKAQLIKEKITADLYSQKSKPALQLIKEELLNTYEEYNNMRLFLSEKMSVYDKNPKLAELAKKYSLLQQRIMKKKNDIQAISN